MATPRVYHLVSQEGFYESTLTRWYVIGDVLNQRPTDPSLVFFWDQALLTQTQDILVSGN